MDNLVVMLDSLDLPKNMKQALAEVEARNAKLFAATVGIIALYQETQHPWQTKIRRWKSAAFHWLKEGKKREKLRKVST